MSTSTHDAAATIGAPAAPGACTTTGGRRGGAAGAPSSRRRRSGLRSRGSGKCGECAEQRAGKRERTHGHRAKATDYTDPHARDPFVTRLASARAARSHPPSRRRCARLALRADAASAHEPTPRKRRSARSSTPSSRSRAWALEQGIRAAFLANFADDGIAFEPAPVRLRRDMVARGRRQPNPHALKLEWKPAQAGVARSLDMGYTTGPFTLSTRPRDVPPRHGVFFSVWQRDARRAWKVMLDMGISTPRPVDFAALGAAPRPRFDGRADACPRSAKDADAREARTLGRRRRRPTAGDLRRRVAADVRLHRDGAPPIAARAAVATAVRDARRRASSWTPQDVARVGCGRHGGQLRPLSRDRALRPARTTATTRTCGCATRRRAGASPTTSRFPQRRRDRNSRRLRRCLPAMESVGRSAS